MQRPSPPQAAMSGVIAPAREIYRVERKVFPNGRILEWTWQLVTRITPEMSYLTWELGQAPTLDCPCTPISPDDVVSCTACHALVCVRRHSATCQKCGLVFGSCCLIGITLDSVRAVVCKPCGETLTASTIRRMWKGVHSWIWD